jgi:hypothetical protein
MVRLLMGAAVLVLLGAGCGRRGSDETTRYVPAVETAREALTAALTGWNAGGPPTKLAGSSVAVQFVDRQRQNGRKLRSFAVLGEAPGEGPRCFAVRLLLEGPDEEKRVRYVVLGVDPVWVFRHEDYELMTHWDCPMEEGKDARAARPAEEN